MFFVYLFYAELIILPLLLISVFVHQRTKMQSLALQLADVSAKLDTVERAQTRAPQQTDENVRYFLFVSAPVGARPIGALFLSAG